LVEADIEVERSRRHLCVHAAPVGVERVRLLDDALRARRVAAVLRELVPRARHARRAAPARHAVDVGELALGLLDPGQELEHAWVRGRAPEHVDERAELVVVGGAARHRIGVAVLIDERRRQAERAGRERIGQHRGELRALVGGRGAVPGVVAHHVDAQVRVTDQRGQVDRSAVRRERVVPFRVRLPRPRDA